MKIIEWILTVVVVIVSILAILLVLLQSGKGGGGLFGGDVGSQSIIGADRKGDFFSRLTSIFLAIFIGGSFLLAYLRFEIDKGKSPVKPTLNESKVETSKPDKSEEKSDKSDKKTTNSETEKKPK